MTKLKYIDGSLIGKKYKPGIEFVFHLAVPCVECEEFALFMEHDGQWTLEANINSMLKLAEEGKAPYCVTACVEPGNLLLQDGVRRFMRMNNYDMFDREYGDFLVYELIPYIEETYAIKFSKSPDMHLVSGGSSGGISAFVIAWFHPDYFHRIYMSSPSFLAMGRGNEIPYLVRKYETKPFRIYEECSENEPNDYFGWSRGIDEEAREAFLFANYDFAYKYFEGESHCSRYRDDEQAYIRNEWLWRDWQNIPVTAPGNSPRVDKVIPFNTKWKGCEEFPCVNKSVHETLSSMYDKVVLSNDEYVWYAANEQEDSVYMFADDKRNLHAILHTMPLQHTKGAIDMVVDKTDRLFVLTEIGIQCVRSFGLIDVILDLPDSSRPKEIAITDALYIKTEEGIYKRALCEACITDSAEKRKQVDYYD